MHLPSAPNPTPPSAARSPRLTPQSALSTRIAEVACDVAPRWRWDSLDGRRPEPLRAELDAHLAIGAACPTHVAFARAMRRALTDVGRQPEGSHA